MYSSSYARHTMQRKECVLWHHQCPCHPTPVLDLMFHPRQDPSNSPRTRVGAKRLNRREMMRQGISIARFRADLASIRLYPGGVQALSSGTSLGPTDAVERPRC